MRRQNDPTEQLLFVTFAGGISQGIQGGVQKCSWEYVELFRKIGYEVTFFTLDDPTSRFLSFIRRSGVQPYRYFDVKKTSAVIASHVNFRKAQLIAINHSDLACVGQGLRGHMSEGQRLILCSHGNKSTDLGTQWQHAQTQASISLPIWNAYRLGRCLEEESRCRSSFDMIFCLSELDVQLEYWLGAAKAWHVPRPISGGPLHWQPINGRAGFVGTIDHPPTLGALISLGDALVQLNADRDDLQIRLVGGPRRAFDRWLARYPYYSYLGRLADDELAKEASTWSLALHPMFSYPMGCSTKLAELISYEIPILTTLAGIRGYSYANGLIGDVSKSALYALQLLQILRDRGKLDELRERVKAARKAAPAPSEVAIQMKTVVQELWYGAQSMSRSAL